MKKLMVLGCIVVLFIGCVQSQTTTKNEPAASQPAPGLPADELAELNDSFDRFRDDLWEKSFHLFREGEEQTFKAADMVIEEGQLVLRTPRGAFSTGTCEFKYWLVGDFDLQMDVAVDFQNERQTGHFGFFDEEGKSLALLFMRGKRKNRIAMDARNATVKVGAAKTQMLKRKMFNGFNGSVRAVRRGDRMSFSYRLKGKSQWTKFSTSRYTADDIGLLVGLKNFYMEFPPNPTPTGPSVMRYDNLVINAAQGIEERGEI